MLSIFKLELNVGYMGLTFNSDLIRA